MYVRIKLVPARIRTVGSFQAPDPWNGGRPTDFNLEAYKMVPKGTKRPGDVWGGKEIYGIRSEIDGTERMLPEALSVLCMEGKIAREALPRLLAEISPTLKRRDFDPVWHSKAHYVFGVFFGLIAAACLTMAALQVVQSVSAAGHAPVRTTLAEWLARPQVENENVITEGGAKLEGSVDAAFTPVAPPDTMPYPSNDGRYRLGWVHASTGERLLLFPAMLAAAGSVSVTGVTLPVAVVGVPTGVLASLRTRVPKLEAGLVTCVFWSWTDGYAGTPVGGVIWAIMAAIAVIGGAIPVLMFTTAKSRRKKQMQWVLARK